ncbi:copper resistance CopC family protein [Bacillus sp. V5-8f]|uniref:copper resistance CopC family protein n=1 Tax=Bacillus sp. V5-8f TaxID=2053044 RepID=UPI000C786BE8|nr:copper resistance CopC family protein [Bacillus sp. V5-8f]PLT33930.1 hypothetical protein CUU64_11275 [Bacillus sp. V5-8f]
MKKLLLFFAVFFLVPGITSAHTGLSSSNPKDGQVVIEDLKEITLTYETKIETLSTMKLIKDGTEIPFQQIKVEENRLIGTLSESLRNGPYVVEWKIVGADGHPITGNISFTVQLQDNMENEQESIEEPDKSEATEKKQPTGIEHEKSASPKESDTTRSTLITVVASILVLILVAGLFLILRKKR